MSKIVETGEHIVQIFKAIPKPLLETFAFIGVTIWGSVDQMLRHNGKLTIRKILAEIFKSIFIAFIVYAVFDQFFNFNIIFTLAICAFASSKSNLLSIKLEDFISFIFDLGKKFLTKKSKVDETP